MPANDRVSEIVRRLEHDIVSGQLAAGDLLPSERDVSAQLGVSRSVVREAINRLASLGLVRSVHGSGTRVEAPNGRLVSVGYELLLRRGDLELEHLSAVRLPLEVTMAALAAQRRTDEHLRRMEHAQAILGNPRRPLEEHVQADLEFHAALADATGNPLFALVLAPIQELLMESRRRTLGRYGSGLAHRHHARILAAVAAGDADAAGRAMREHLETNIKHLTEMAREATPKRRRAPR